MSAGAEMEILSDMMGGGSSPFGEIIEQGQNNSYYSSFGVSLLKQFETKEHYYHFLLSVVGDFKTLDQKEKQMIQNKMGIFPETIIKEKIVYKEKVTKTTQKPKINRFDDY